jgi:Uma2 family endonuclease
MELLIKHRITDGMTDEEFYELCAQNRDLKFERTAERNIIVMSPTHTFSGEQNAEITYQLRKWNKIKKLGKVFDSSTGFTLPNSAVRSPDACFIFNEQWSALSSENKKGFARICPDFIIELMSDTDTLEYTTKKMQEYMSNGCKLGWIIEPRQKQVHIFRFGKEIEILKDFNQSISADELLPGFALDLAELENL